MIKVGVIGCGKIAQKRHIPEYLANEDAQVIGYCDINLPRAQALADEFGGTAYESYKDLLEDDEIEAVSVCTPNNSHAEITIAALKAGKHVLCEKPMATTMADSEAMVRAAKEAGRFLMIGHNQRLTKTHIKAKELLESGLIGELISFRTTFGHRGPETWSIDPGNNTWFFDKAQSGIGAMADLGVHKTDLIHFLTGQVVVETTASLNTLDKRYDNGELIDVDDHALCIYRLSGGAVGTMVASWVFNGAEDNSTVLYGTEGVMRIYDDPIFSIKVFRKDGEKIFYDVDAIQTNTSQTSSGVIDMFIDSLEQNVQPPLSGEEALKAMRAIIASIESAEMHQTVVVKQY